MHPIDWTLLAAFILASILVARFTRKYMHSVADFLAANRCAGKYIIAMGDGMAGFGAISLIGAFQQYYEGGFTQIWWFSLSYPFNIFMAITGWVIYRFRRTRAMTMAQFFEMRYSRRFRVFSGLLIFLSGIINFGIFPAVGSRFFIYYAGLPEYFNLGGIPVSTYAAIMAVLIGLALWFTFLGGQITVLVTDFLQSVFCNIMFIILVILFFYWFDWSQIQEAVAMRPDDQSMINPYKIGGLENYNLFYFLIAYVMIFYTAYAWQGQQGYNTSARTPHDVRMAKVLGYIRALTPLLMMAFIPVCVYTLLHHPDFQPLADEVTQELSRIENEQVRSQMRIPVTLSKLLPIGILGLFAAMMYAAFVTTHDTYLHSWGSIFMQDVVLPFRKKSFTPEQHINYLRWSIFGVAVFIYLFSLFYRPDEDILMFFAYSGTIFLGGSGSVIIGGLYWKRGSTVGAWAAMIVSCSMAFLGFGLHRMWVPITSLLQENWPQTWTLLERTFPTISPDEFMFTGQEIFFFTAVASILSYVLLSLLFPPKKINLDRIFHHGKYAVASDSDVEDIEAPQARWREVLGIDKRLTLEDRFIIGFAYSYIVLALVIIGIGTLLHFTVGISDEAWFTFWRGFSSVFFCLSILFGLWLSIGGIIDLRKLFKTLGAAKRDDTDDGRVRDDYHLDEEEETALSEDSIITKD